MSYNYTKDVVMQLSSHRLGVLYGQYFRIFEELGMFDKLYSGKFAASLSPTPMHIHYGGPLNMWLAGSMLLTTQHYVA
jgi:hypothetical protein